MPSSRTSSSSSTELPGFRLEREIGRGSAAVVYEATQISLHRSVALKLFEADPTAGGLRWPEHPHAVSLYAAGPCENGYFVAMQLVRGSSLARLLARRRPAPATLLAMLADVAAALDAAHRAGIAHGAVAARNVLVDDEGRAYLSDFGLRSPGATPESDRADFAALLGECLGMGAPDPLPATAEEIVASGRLRLAPDSGVRRAGWAAIALGAIAVGVAALLGVFSGAPEQAPARLPGTVAIGSSLPAGGVRSVDCAGHSPSGGSEPCVVVQTRLAGRPVAARQDGTIRRWAVHGARGELALEVLRRRGRSLFLVARTQYATIADAGVHTLRANLPVRAGDLVGLAVAPGAGVGVRSVAGATTRRRFGLADLDPAPFDSAAGTGAHQELMLRVEYAPGARWTSPGRLTGRAAARAPAGRELDVLGAQQGLTVAAVRVGGAIAVDLFLDERRLTRVPFPGDPAGRLESLYTLRQRFGQQIVRLLWRNPSGPVSRDYLVTGRSLVPID